MSATDTITVGRALPKLASVEPGDGPFSVSVTWATGERVGRTDIVDLAPMIFTFKVFTPIRDNPKLFRMVQLGEWGASLVWPGNDDLDIGADSVEEMAEEVMTNSEFAAFLKRSGFTFDAAAAQLGIARRLVAYYAKDREIPRYIALACRQLEAEHGASTGKNDVVTAKTRNTVEVQLPSAFEIHPDALVSYALLWVGVSASGRDLGAPAFSYSNFSDGGRIVSGASVRTWRIDNAPGQPVPAGEAARRKRDDF